jgi:hypothetical protein
MTTDPVSAPPVPASTSPSALRAGLALGGALLTLILVLNLLGDGIAPVSDGEFRQLLTRGEVSRVVISGERVVAELARAPDSPAPQSDRVVVERSAASISAAEREHWRQAGIEVVVGPAEAGTGQPGPGLWLIGAFLAVGAWYLWDQVQQDRHGPGSPRRRLAVLEKQLEEGAITPDEFRRRADELAAEL